MPFTDRDLLSATQLLKRSLVLPIHIGINIICPRIVLSTKILDHNGLLVGFFKLNAQCRLPEFVLYNRPDLYGEADAIVVVRINPLEDLLSIEDILAVKQFAYRPISGDRIGTINIRYEAPENQYLMTLVAAAWLCCDKSLFDPFHSVRRFRIKGQVPLLRYPKSIDHSCVPLSGGDFLEKFDSLYYITEIINFNDKARYLGMPFVIRICLDGHCFYAINKPTGTAVCFLPHVFQLNHDQVGGASRLMRDLLGHNEFVVTRFKSEDPVNCEGDIIAEVIATILAYQPHVFPHIYPRYLCDSLKDIEPLDDIIRSESKCKASNLSVVTTSTFSEASAGRTGQQISYPRSASQEAYEETSIEYMNLGLSSILKESAGLSCIKENIRKHRDQINKLSKSELPPFIIEPINDPYNNRFGHAYYFAGVYKAIVERWKQYVPSKLLPMINKTRASSDFILTNTRKRMVVQMIHDTDFNAAVVVDHQAKQWIYINPDRESAVYHDIKHSVMRDNVSMAQYKCDEVNCSSYYQTEYPLVHLGFCLFTIGKLFKLAICLPARLNYTEGDFRKYCWLMCYQTQVTNHERNISLNLVREDGSLQFDAYICQQSPVQFERAVVPMDQCMFCKRRNFVSLSRHISMAHGGQSSNMNHIRHEK